MSVDERKQVIQKVIERLLPKYEKSGEFNDDLEALIKKYPLDTEVNFEPATFIVEETN